MVQRLGICACVLALGAWAAGCGGSSSRSRGATTAPITSQGPTFRTLAQGSDTALVTSANAFAWRALGNQRDWDSLWASHGGTGPAPAADFARETVVALFLGERPTDAYGIEVAGVAQVSSASPVVYEVTYRETRAATGQGPATHPYHFVAVDRIDGSYTFRQVASTNQGVLRQLQGVHGELVALATGGGQVLGFLEDGASDPLEVSDPAALTAAGLEAGFSLVVSGDVRQNAQGQSPVAEALEISAFDVDTVVTTMEPEVVGGQVLLRDVDGALYVPQGPLANAVLAQPVARPLRITGRIAAVQAPPTGDPLEVTSWRRTETLSLTESTPLLGSSTFAVDDLAGAGAYRFQEFTVLGNNGTREDFGRGRALLPAQLTQLRSRLGPAALNTRPAVYAPAQIMPDHPSTSLRFTDATSEVSITIYAGAVGVPAEVTALVSELQAVAATVPHVRPLYTGQQSSITQASVEVARDQTALNSLWQRSGGTGAPPTVDFSHQAVLAVFLGQRTTGGYGIRVSALEKIGGSLHAAIQRTAPTGAAPSVITSPYQLVLIEGGAAAVPPIVVEGQRY